MAFQMTIAGAELFAQATDERKLEFTGVWLGDSFAEDAEIPELTDIVSRKLKMTIFDVSYGAYTWMPLAGAIVETGNTLPSSVIPGTYFFVTSTSKLYEGSFLTWEELPYDPTGSTVGAYKYDPVTGVLSRLVADDTVITITAKVSNDTVQETFKVREQGLFAKIGNGDEVLFAYRSIGDEKGNTVSRMDTAAQETIELKIVLSVGAGGSVILLSETSTVTHAEFDALANDYAAEKQRQRRLESTLAETLGVESLEQFDPTQLVLETEDNTGSIVVPTSISGAKPAVGDTLLALIGKVKGIVNNVILHVANTNNPHGVTAAQIGAAEIIVGTYTGDGDRERYIDVGKEIRAVYVSRNALQFPVVQGAVSDRDQAGGGLAIVNEPVYTKTGSADKAIWIYNTGFKVAQMPDGRYGTVLGQMNQSGVKYNYIAIC